jgi:hypothetical protein
VLAAIGFYGGRTAAGDLSLLLAFCVGVYAIYTASPVCDTGVIIRLPFTIFWGVLFGVFLLIVRSAVATAKPPASTAVKREPITQASPLVQPKIPTAEEIAKEYAKLQARTLPPPPPGKVRKPDTKVTLTATAKGIGEASLPLTWVDNPCIEADRFSWTRRQTTPDKQQQAMGLKYWRSVTVLELPSPVFRFRIRSSAPIKRLDFEGDTNLEIIQWYKGLEVVDIRARKPTVGPIHYTVFSDENIRYACPERLN